MTISDKAYIHTFFFITTNKCTWCTVPVLYVMYGTGTYDFLPIICSIFCVLLTNERPLRLVTGMYVLFCGIITPTVNSTSIYYPILFRTYTVSIDAFYLLLIGTSIYYIICLPALFCGRTCEEKGKDDPRLTY